VDADVNEDKRDARRKEKEEEDEQAGVTFQSND